MNTPIPQTPETDRWWGRLSRASVDFGLLRRSPNYGLMFGAQTVSMAGSLVTLVAIPYQLYQITGSSLAVGLLGAAEFLPILFLALIGGAIADSFDRKRIIVTAEAGSAAIMAVLVIHSLLDGRQLWVLFICAALLAALTAFQRPAFDSLAPRLVAAEDYKTVAALHGFSGGVTSIVGPALGGVLIASIGLASTYIVDLISFSIALVVLVRIKAPPTPSDAPSPSFKSVVEGLHYAWSRPVLLGTYLVDISAMFFAMPMALYPALSKDFGGPTVLGLLYAAPAAGYLVMTLTSGWTKRIQHHGRAVALAAGGWGVAIVGFGFSNNLPLALLCLALAGVMDAISGIFRGTIWNETIPDHLRGRLAGIEMISWSAGPLLGNAKSGAVASGIGLRGSIVSGGIACVLSVAALIVLIPKMWAYRSEVSAAVDGSSSDAQA